MQFWFLSILILFSCSKQSVEGWTSTPCYLPGSLVYAINCFKNHTTNQDLELISVNTKEDCDDTIYELNLVFDLAKTVDENQARKLVLNLLANLLNSFNNNQKLRPLFSISPLTANEVTIQIRIRPSDCGADYPIMGNIASVTVADGKVIYGTLNSYTYQIDILRTETLKKAQQLLNWQNESQL